MSKDYPLTQDEIEAMLAPPDENYRPTVAAFCDDDDLIGDPDPQKSLVNAMRKFGDGVQSSEKRVKIFIDTVEKSMDLAVELEKTLKDVDEQIRSANHKQNFPESVNVYNTEINHIVKTLPHLVIRGYEILKNYREEK